MRQYSDRNAGSRSSAASGPSDAGGTPGKRTLVEQVYGPAGVAPVQRKADDGDGAAGATDADTSFPRVAAIANNGLDAAALRRALTADPSLAREIPMYLAAGGAPQLNDLMAAAYPAVAVTQAERPATVDGPVGSSAIVKGEGTKSEKQPTDPTQPLPAARPGNKPLDKGVMKSRATASTGRASRPSVARVRARTAASRYGCTSNSPCVQSRSRCSSSPHARRPASRRTPSRPRPGRAQSRRRRRRRHRRSRRLPAPLEHRVPP